MATKARAEGRELDPAEISARVARVLAQREIRATLDALAAAGSPARYLAVDVQDADAIRAALDDVRREWGPVTALVHGAGVLADKRIVDKTDEQFDRVFDTKVAGLRALLSATAHDPLGVDLRVLVDRGAHRQPGAVRLRDGQRGAEPRRRLGARAAGRRLCRALDRLGAVGGRHGDAVAREALRADGSAADPAGRRCTHVRRRAAGRAAERCDRGGRRRRRRAARRRGGARPSRSSCASTPRRTPTSRTTGSRGRRWCRWRWRSSGSCAAPSPCAPISRAPRCATSRCCARSSSSASITAATSSTCAAAQVAGTATVRRSPSSCAAGATRCTIARAVDDGAPARRRPRRRRRRRRSRPSTRPASTTGTCCSTARASR